MPVYEYRAINSKGSTVKGSVDAENQRAARTKLKKEGIFVTEIRDKKKSSTGRSSKRTAASGRVSLKDLSLATRQLATLVKSSIPLVDALAALSEQVENPTLKDCFADIKNMVNEGTSFSKALSKYPKVFNNIYCSMSEAGEMSGTLDVILLRLAEFQEAQEELNARVSTAMVYPSMVVSISILMLVGLIVFLIPMVVQVFENNPDLVLPWYTLFLIQMSDFLRAYWWAFGLFFVASYLLFAQWKRTPEGSKAWDRFLITAPVFGQLVRMVAVSRFTRTLATLLTGGVPMLQSLDIVRRVVGNQILEEAIEEARNNISEGETIAGPLKKSGQFPPVVLHMISVGEKTGELEHMLARLSDAFDFQVKAKIDQMMALLGPVTLIFLAIILFAIMGSVLVPLMEMATSAIG